MRDKYFRTKCYWFNEYQDMNAIIPTCNYYEQYGSCSCSDECEHYISEQEVEKIIRQRVKTEWIPCSERLPSDSGDYLVWLEDESEHYAVIPFDTNAKGFGWWQDYYHPISLGFLDSEFIKAKNVTAWQPLPKPYREDGKA